MRLFKQRPSIPNPKAEALAARIVGHILQKQTKAANFLNSKTQHWNRTTKLIALAVFVLVFGGLSCYYIIKSF